MRRKVITLLGLFLLVLPAFSARAQAESGVGVRLSAERLNLGMGNETTVDILADDVSPVYGVDVRLKFNPTELEVVDADAALSGIQLAHGDFINPARSFILLNQADNEIGMIVYALTLLRPAPSVEGNGVLARITFRAKAEGWATVSIEQASFGTQTGQTIQPMPVSLQADFTASTTGGTGPLTVVFTNLSSGNYIASSWDFGDGVTSTATNPTHTYMATGLYPVRLTVAGAGGEASSALLVITIDNVAPTVGAGSDRMVSEGEMFSLSVTIFDPDPLDTHMATLHWDDGTVTAVQVESENRFSSNHVYIDDGTYSLKIEVCDEAGGCGHDDVIVSVANTPPLVEEITAPLLPLLVNTEVTVSAGFMDPGLLDTHTAIWNWEDGNTSPGVISESNGSGTINGSHSYSQPGVYTLRLSVTDNDGGIGESTFRYVVIYDPEGGWVTGNGRYDSPTGAYLGDSSLMGRADFGLNATYKKGSAIPVGDIKFEFKGANFKFRSETYEWLAIFGARAWFKGTGTVNGVGGYRFLVTAIDGDVDPLDNIEADRFRIKVWQEAENGAETIVYDNGFGSTDFSEAWATQLDNGKIMIHH